MKLLRLKFGRYRQFIDERLEVDPEVTAIVGRNDTGKTGVIGHFFHQCVYEGVIHGGDKPAVPSFKGAPTSYSLEWTIDPDDYGRFQYPTEFGSPAEHTLVTSFQESEPSGKHWTYLLDGRELGAYECRSQAGRAIRKKGFELRNILPIPRYVNPERSLRSVLEMRPWDYPDDPGEFIRRAIGVEARLLRLGGIKAQTRDLAGPEQPWSPRIAKPLSITPEEIAKGLNTASEKVTAYLRAWWQDPPELRLEAKLAGRDSHPSPAITCNILDAEGGTYWGTGLWWFVTFVVELMFIQDTGHDSLLFFDEPATPLDPSAQRMVARLLGSMAPAYQVLYSTHSPFMIDWSFPQRVRLFLRDDSSKRTNIINKPYAQREKSHDIWDPLRESIGVTLGDIGILNHVNVLVEGVSDQILLANASALLKRQSRRSLDLNRVSVIPYSDTPTLTRLISMVKSRGHQAAVVCDNDQQGKRTQKICQTGKVPYVDIGEFCDGLHGDKSLEDLVGIAGYVSAVNEFYKEFPWFNQIEVSSVESEIGERSLGKYLADFFDEHFESRGFDKISVAIFIAQSFGSQAGKTLDRFEALIERIIKTCPGM